MDPLVPLHNVGLVGVTVKVGSGFTVTVTVKVLPAQLPDVGVTV